MYRGFNLELKKLSFNGADVAEKFNKAGSLLHAENLSKVKKNLDNFTRADGVLEASKMGANWFPHIRSDIFISHSHKDKETALTLSGWLKERFKLTSFIDSCAWGYANDLLALIDKKYCWNADKKTYDYDKRNQSTTHVHMMLSTALSKMIDQSECILFLNTPESITPINSVNLPMETTSSPWIYSEIAMTSLIRKRRPDRYRTDDIMKSLSKAAILKNEMKVAYDINLSHLTPLNSSDIFEWRDGLDEAAHPLDVLYNLHPAED